MSPPRSFLLIIGIWSAFSFTAQAQPRSSEFRRLMERFATAGRCAKALHAYPVEYLAYDAYATRVFRDFDSLTLPPKAERPKILKNLCAYARALFGAYRVAFTEPRGCLFEISPTGHRNALNQAARFMDRTFGGKIVIHPARFLPELSMDAEYSGSSNTIFLSLDFHYLLEWDHPRGADGGNAFSTLLHEYLHMLVQHASPNWMHIGYTNAESASLPYLERPEDAVEIGSYLEGFGLEEIAVQFYQALIHYELMKQSFGAIELFELHSENAARNLSTARALSEIALKVLAPEKKYEPFAYERRADHRTHFFADGKDLMLEVRTPRHETLKEDLEWAAVAFDQAYAQVQALRAEIEALSLELEAAFETVQKQGAPTRALFRKADALAARSKLMLDGLFSSVLRYPAPVGRARPSTRASD